MPCRVVDLHELDLRELFEIGIDEVGDVVIPAIGETGAFEINMCNAIDHFELAVTSEAVVNGGISIGIFFRCTGTFEVFIESSERHGIRA